MAMHDLFTNLISPKLALGMLRKQIETELNEHFTKAGKSAMKLESYIIDIDVAKQTTFFIIDKKPYAHADGEKLARLVTKVIEQKLKGSDTIDKIIINYTPQKIEVTTAYIQDNQKQVKKITL